ncbi:MAG: class I SAM-dependent RNA methyltransferase [Kineosporiaceae bacterium]
MTGRRSPRSRAAAAGAPAAPAALPDPVELEIGEVAHGGHCVARHDGRVVFVRHALPGERVLVRFTEAEPGARFWRGDAVEVVRADPGRVQPPCPWARPGACGGCDWQHATLDVQRELKQRVLAEQLTRLGGFDLDAQPWWPVAVAAVPGDDDGLGWRTRVRFAVDAAGRAGLRGFRSHEVVPIDWCRIAHPQVSALDVTGRPWPGVAAVDVVGVADGEQRLAVVEPRDGARAPRRRTDLPPLAAEASIALDGGEGPVRLAGRAWVSETVELPSPAGSVSRAFRVGGAGFWQVHPGAAATLARTVLDFAAPRAGERAWDLYSGVGLFSAALALAVGGDGGVVAVESGDRAVRDARRNLHDLPWVEVVGERVERWVATEQARPDVVVLDPPRSGAGAAVIDAVLAARPRVIVLVACDPAALARDLRRAVEAGWRVERMEAFDLFPMTHHLETVAQLVPASS